MNSSPLVSVLVNNYNYARFLPEAISSVLEQSYKNIEVIIVDDGSTDNSRAVIEALAAKHSLITPIFKQNGGQASAYNAGVAAARGEVLCFLDSDDYWFPNKLERVVQALERHAFVQHDVLKQGRPNFQIPTDCFDRRRLLCEFGYLYLFSPSSAMSMRRELAEKIFPIPEAGLELCADLFFMFIGTYLEGIHTLEEQLSEYRIHDGNNWQMKGKDRPWAAVRKYFNVLEMVNRRLFDMHLYSIPTFNRILHERLLVDTLDIKAGGRYFVYGTGERGDMVAELIQHAGGVIEAFVDSFERNWNKSFLGIQIIGPHELSERLLKSPAQVVVASSFVTEILKVLKEHCVDMKHIKYPPYMFPAQENKAASEGAE